LKEENARPRGRDLRQEKKKKSRKKELHKGKKRSSPWGAERNQHVVPQPEKEEQAWDACRLPPWPPGREVKGGKGKENGQGLTHMMAHEKKKRADIWRKKTPSFEEASGSKR